MESTHEKDQPAVAWTEHSDSDLARQADQEEREMGVFATIRSQPKVVGWSLMAISVCLLASFENQAAGMVLSIPKFREDFGYEYEGDYVLYANWQSAHYGGPIAATVVGTLLAGFLADKFGRKPMLIGSLLVSYAAIALEFVATTNAMFFGGKFLNGFATGIMMSVSMTYVSEMAPLALRGILTCVTALMFTLGPLASAIIVDETGSLDSRWAYRAVFCAQFGFAAIPTALVPWMPESPVWLYSTERHEAAVSSLRRLGYSDDHEGAATNTTTSAETKKGPSLQKRLAQIKTTLEDALLESSGATYAECFRPANLRRTVISIMPLTIQALCGVMFIGSYGTYYIQLAGFSTAQSFKLQIAQHGLAMFGNICSWFLVDRVGRRPLTFWGLAVITVILMVCAGLAVHGTKASVTGSVALIVAYNFFYNISIGATAYTLLCEVATLRLRIKTISIGIVLQYIFYALWAFVLPMLFNPDQADLGAKTAFIFGGLSVICLVYLWFFQVETAGRNYKELDEMFAKGVSARHSKGFQSTVQREHEEEKQVLSRGQKKEDAGLE